ncbi:hypothetical protein BT69DRAFT_1355221 [Atractiella rhizophila]|nr:hypothetical protein BT69DRAFT_1356594 [Atractiella rhizophila]KAH8916901.1 hypothetical protein BT69DRAFT_1355221 [Atractiella rhizophila]
MSDSPPSSLPPPPTLPTTNTTWRDVSASKLSWTSAKRDPCVVGPLLYGLVGGTTVGVGTLIFSRRG